MITVNELFSGIGSQSAALNRLGVDFKVVGIAEIDKYAIKSYEAIHGSVKNYGDISVVEKLDYADFWTYSFPCQDISIAGNQAGINKNTRSGLLYQVERLLNISKENNELPKWLMLENVKNLVGKKFKPQFEAWIKRLDELGYNTYWKVLNAKNYGIPQNRERVFAISIRKDIDMGYEFPIGFDNGKRLKDILESEVDEKYYLSEQKINISGCVDCDNCEHRTDYELCDISNNDETCPLINKLISKSEFGRMGIQAAETYNENKPIYGNTINPFNKTFDKSESSPTLTTRPEGFKTAIIVITKDLRIRKLTPLECWRLMGFTDEQFRKAEKFNSNSQLYKQAGNSIVVDVLYYLFKNLFISN